MPVVPGTPDGPAPPIDQNLLNKIGQGAAVSQPFVYQPEDPNRMLNTSREAGGKPVAQQYGGRQVDYQAELKRDQALMQNAVAAFGFDVNLQREPSYWIHVFNISPNTYVRERPPQFPRITLKGCPPKEQYIEVMRIPDVVNEKEINPDTGLVTYRGTRGERFATDLINPANLTNNMWADIQPSWLDGGTSDLSQRGVFWSKNAVPTPQELKMARQRLERHYRQEFQRAEDLARAGKAAEIGREAHVAADYLRLSTSWHVMTDVPNPCPNCGDPVKPGIAYHASSVGGICVIDWQRTVAAGVKTRADVPPEARWWQEPQVAEQKSAADPLEEFNRKRK